MVHDLCEPHTDEERKGWVSNEFGGTLSEELPDNMPQPRGMGFVMSAKVDADHAVDTTTGRSSDEVPVQTNKQTNTMITVSLFPLHPLFHCFHPHLQSHWICSQQVLVKTLTSEKGRISTCGCPTCGNSDQMSHLMHLEVVKGSEESNCGKKLDKKEEGDGQSDHHALHTNGTKCACIVLCAFPFWDINASWNHTLKIVPKCSLEIHWWTSPIPTIQSLCSTNFLPCDGFDTWSSQMLLVEQCSNSNSILLT